jgi:hypothetical protein
MLVQSQSLRTCTDAEAASDQETSEREETNKGFPNRAKQQGATQVAIDHVHLD